MDPELIAYLDERFRGIDERFRGIDERFQGMDERFRETSQQIQGFREETSHRFDRVDERLAKAEEKLGQLDEQLRWTDVKVEALHNDIRQVAEGVIMMNQKLDASKEEVAREFKDTKALLQAGYRDLDKRVKVLERRARTS